VTGLIRSGSLTHYAEVARDAGLDPARMLAEFHLPRRCLDDPEVKVPIDAVRALLEASAERSGAEAFGVLMAETRRLSSLGPVGLLVREQPTLRLAIEALVRYSRRMNESLLITIEESGDVVVLREEVILGHAGPVRQSTELAIAVMFRMLRTFLGADWRPKLVCFAHDAPADRSVHERVFGRCVEFGHDFNGIVCSARDLEAPNTSADPEMARYARQLVETGLGSEGPGYATQVREIVFTLLGTGVCTIDRVAQQFGVDRRTLHRRLADEGESFSAILDAVRRELVARYLDNRERSLADVSSLLGFSAPSGFSRWYRKQFDSAPSNRRTRRAGKSVATRRTA
jgi:AraC-like DNA-binding protein